MSAEGAGILIDSVDTGWRITCEVGVWDSALTTSEITSLSNGTSPGTIQTNNLKAYYDFEDNTNDQSGNSKNAVGTSNTSYNASTPY